MRHLYPEGFTFQQDNSPVHKAYVVMDYLDENVVQVLDWSAYSPDMPPIENVWAWLKEEIGKIAHR